MAEIEALGERVSTTNLRTAVQAESADHGDGRWLVAHFLPTALFSLKMSQATSSVGKTLLVPTMYAIKMALVDAGFRAGLSDEDCADLVRALAPVDVRIAPPDKAVVTHTFVKIRQEPKKADPLKPYGSSIAYREVVSFSGDMYWAFDLADRDGRLKERLELLLPHVNYIGRRGCFIQFAGMHHQPDVTARFTQPDAESGFEMPESWHLALLDDFGAEASLAVLSSFSPARAAREKHRRFVQTVVPIGISNSGPGFTEYSAHR